MSIYFYKFIYINLHLSIYQFIKQYCYVLFLCYNCVMKSDKVRKNYYLKREIAEFAEVEASEKGCSISYFIQMLIEHYQRNKMYGEEE